METKTGKIRVAKTKGGREEEERRKEIKRKGTRQKEKTKEGKDNRSEESSRGVGNLG